LYGNCGNTGSDPSNTYGNGGALIKALMESGCHLVGNFGTAPKQKLSPPGFEKIYFI